MCTPCEQGMLKQIPHLDYNQLPIANNNDDDVIYLFITIIYNHLVKSTATCRHFKDLYVFLWHLIDDSISLAHNEL